jgi:hypothetical protein
MVTDSNSDDERGAGSESWLGLLNRRTFLGTAAGVGTGIALSDLSVEGAATPSSPDRIREGDTSVRQTVASPNGDTEVAIDVSDGTSRYSLTHNGQKVIEPSALGFEFENAPPLDGDFAVTGSKREQVNYVWQPVWGRYADIRNHYHELILGLREQSGQRRSLTLTFRVYNDGVGFRYTLPEQKNIDEFTITDENTVFRFADDYAAWGLPLRGDDRGWNEYELLYDETELSVIEDVHTPLTLVGDDLSVSVHEAALTDYASMALSASESKATTLESTLAPLPDTGGKKVIAAAPHQSPWRTIQLGTNPGDLIESNLIVNLNEPQDDLFSDDQYGTDWIRPQKFMGVWWLMITGRATWEQGITHGATTERAKRYMDFASEHGIPSLLVEGWNIGWDEWIEDSDDFDFTDDYDDYDLEEVVEYGQNLDPSVDIVIHNETGGAVDNYESQIDEAFDLYQELGIHANKTGYVADRGLTLNGKEHYHHDQAMVNHYERVTREGAKREIMFEIHEPVKPTGKRRTYPNLMTREGLKGQEFDAFGDLPPSHHVTLPFTRMLGGPMEFTPGMFNLRSGNGGVNTTRAKQLAMYPVYFSGLQMVADTPEAYMNENGDVYPEFEFIEHVPATWDDTVVLNAVVGDYITIARQNGEEWYVGSQTNGSKRALDVPLSFLEEDSESNNDKYVAYIYTDGADAVYTDGTCADLRENETAVVIDEVIVDPSDTIVASMIESGGQAIRLQPVNSGTQCPVYEYPEQRYEGFSIPETVDTPASFNVTIIGKNTGNIVGGERLYVYIDGEEITSGIVRFAPGDDEDAISVQAALGPGEYQVTVGPSKKNTLSPRTITVESK